MRANYSGEDNPLSYKPKPIDTSGINLPAGLRKVTEELAEHNHDLWAQKRISDGWNYGPNRDDIKKTHPDLVPYSDLPEAEKDYDRRTAIEVLKAIIAFGYRIHSPPRRPSIDSGFSHQVVQEALARLKRSERIDLTGLLHIWSSISAEHWDGSSKIYELLGNRILKVGEPLLAYDVISAGLDLWPKNVRLRQLLGLALARSGATERANRILSQLYEEGAVDGETLGILARTHKDLSAMASSPDERSKQLAKAYDYYYKGYRNAISSPKKIRLDDAIYNGINAATAALLMRQRNQAEALAHGVRKICLKKLERKKDNYWALASLGEAATILGEWTEAEDRYSEASEQGHRNFADLSSTRRQARILLEHLGLDSHRFDHCFGIPRVVVFAGHMIDQPGRPRPRFPQFLEQKVREGIATRLKKLDAAFGYSSAACGADILFLEEMLKRKGETHVVLPFQKNEFQKASVDIIPNADWGKRFRRILTRVTSVIIASERSTSRSAVAYEYANLLQHGLAILRAKILDTEVIPLAVWDGDPADGPWGTASFVDHWRSQGLEPEIIDIANLRRETTVMKLKPLPDRPLPPKNPVMTHKLPDFSQEIKAMLFADVVGYGRLLEERIPHFVDHFMGLIAKVLNNSSNKPLTKNTWGDALYFVFSSAKDAGNFALELRDRIRGTDWKAKGLPEDLNLRISLHAGTVYYCEDPVIKRKKYTGSHVSRAARIEAITPSGEVYASQEFAALASAQSVREFALDYIGKIPLPKKGGTVPLYLLRRLNP